MKNEIRRNPLIVMTAVTGKPTREEILRYLDELSANGIHQSLLYPRSGCQLTYMSDEWFEAVRCFVDGARTRGMRIWLYDEFNWPSGDAAGQVTANPRFRLKAIKTRGADMGTLITSSNHNAHVFGEKYFPDLMSPEAVEYFISLTHEEYYKRFSEDFGTVIAGMFTDEPSIGYCCRAAEKTKERPNTLFDNEECPMPYYDGMEEDYRARCGRDFYEDMRAKHEDFYSINVDLISERFKTCYIDRLTDWCRSHDIVMTGHLWRDETPFHSTKANGNFLKNLSGFMMPGLDEIQTDLQSHRLLALLSGAEYARGDHGAMIEIFALGPCDMTYQKRLCMLFLTACFKIDHYFLAISPLDMRGNFHITDFFNCFGAAQPDFGGMRLFAKEAELAARYADMDFVPDVYIRYPYAICAKHYADDFGTDPEFTSLLNTLAHYQLQWKYLTEEPQESDVPVVSFTDKMEYVWNGELFDNADLLCQRLAKPLRVTDRDGAAPEGFFVRSYPNGECIVLNLFGKAGIYRIDGKEAELVEHDVYFSRTGIPEDDQKLPLQTTFTVRYYNDNITRLMYLNDTRTSELDCRTDLTVTLSIRSDTEATWNDQPLSDLRPDDVLPNGMSRFYERTKPLSLERGVHTVRSGDKEYKYLPSVFVSGDFAVELQADEIYRVVLKNRSTVCRAGEQFCDYGTVELESTVTIPEGARQLELKGTTLYTEISLDGQALGACIASPYRYDVPPALWGKTVRLTATQRSSLGPIFGDTAHYDAASLFMSWRNTPPTGVTRFGFLEMNWIL